MTTTAPATRRWLLAGAALVAAAERVGVALPAGVGPELDDDTRPLALALLEQGGGCDAEAVLAPDLAAGLEAGAAPVAVVELTVAPVSGAVSPGRSWRAWYVLGERTLLALLQRDDSPLLEVVAAVPTALPGELTRLVSALPTGPGVGDLPPTVVPLAALSQVPREGADLTALAEATGTPTGQLLVAARVAEQAQQTLQVLVTGHPRAGATPVGSLLWYRLPRGWVSVVAVPDGTDRRPVRIAPVAPGQLPAQLAPLLVGAIG